MNGAGVVSSAFSRTSARLFKANMIVTALRRADSSIPPPRWTDPTHHRLPHLRWPSLTIPSPHGHVTTTDVVPILLCNTSDYGHAAVAGMIQGYERKGVLMLENARKNPR